MTTSSVQPPQDTDVASNIAKRARSSTTPKKQRVTKLLNLLPTRKTEKGDIYICGTGDCAQLGKTEDVTELGKPELLEVAGKSFVDVCCGGIHTLALTSEGELFSWGCNDENALGRGGDEYVPEVVTFEDKVDIVQLAAGDSFSAILTAAGEIYLWGTFRTSTGVLGFVGQPGIKQATPMKLVVPGADVQFAQIAAGNNHLLALSTKGSVHVVGDNEAGQLGLRLTGRSANPAKGLNPAPLALKNIVQVAAGGYHSFALAQDGKVYSWGQNNFFQCGIPASSHQFDSKLSTPVVSSSLSQLSPIQKIAAGEHHSLILKSNSSLFGVGRSDSNQLGVAKADSDAESNGKSAVEFPQVVPDFTPVDIESGSNHCLALLSDKICSWGYGESSALGHGVERDEKVPRTIEALLGKKVLKASAGGHHSVFLVHP